MQHKYKIGNRVWWDGLKGRVIKIEPFHGKELYTTDIVFEPGEENPTVKTFGWSLKPIIAVKAVLS